MNIIQVDSSFNKDKFTEILDLVCQKQKYYEDKRIEAISKLVDGEGIELMFNIGRRPEGFRHFNTRTMPVENKLSALRLLDLGMIKTEQQCYKGGFEYAYYWTSLGRAVMRYMNMEEIDVNDFKKTPEYRKALEFREQYKEFKKKIGKNETRNDLYPKK